MGSHQGDPLGSMIYSAGQQQLLRDVLNQLSSKPTGRIRAFIDDISVQGNIDDIQESLQYLIQEGKNYGIKFKKQKIKIYIGNCSHEEAAQRVQTYQRIFDNEIPIGNFSLPTDSKITRGISVMNIPIGTDEYTQKFLQSKLDDISKDITTIMQVEKLHNRWTYIYYILNGKINHLLRGVHKKNLTMELASRLEHLKVNLIQDLLGTELTQFQKFLFQLGISEGGFGLKSLQHTCIAANLASKIEFLRYRLRQLPGDHRTVIENMANNPSQNPYIHSILTEIQQFRVQHGDPTTHTLFYNWKNNPSQNNQTVGGIEATTMDWLINIIFIQTAPLQHQIYQQCFIPTANAFVTQFLNDPNITDGRKAAFLSSSFEHAGKWLMAYPHEGFWMSSREFKTALLLRAGISTSAAGTDLPCACGKGAADDDNHLLSCHLGNQTIKRHDTIANCFQDMIQAAGQSIVMECPLEVAGNPVNQRSDFTIKRNDQEGHQHYDITITNPSSTSAIRETKSHKINGAAAQRAHNSKIRKYSSYIDTKDFHPMVFETYGFWTEEVTQLIKSSCTAIAEQTGIPKSRITQYWLMRISFTLQWENAMLITERADFSRAQDDKATGRRRPWLGHLTSSYAIK